VVGELVAAAAQLILFQRTRSKDTIFILFWGLPPTAAGPLQGSQVCSALRQQAGWVCRCAAPLQAPRPAAASPPASRGCRLKPAANLGAACPPKPI